MLPKIRRLLLAAPILFAGAFPLILYGQEAPAKPAQLEPAPGAPVVEALSGTVQGPLRFPDKAGGSALQVGGRAGDPGGPIPIDEVLSIRFSEERAPPQELLLLFREGNELFAALEGGGESELELKAYAVQPASGGEALKVPLEDLRGIGFPHRWRDAASGVVEVRRWLAAPAEGGTRAEGGTVAEGGTSPAGGAAGKKADSGGDRLLLVEGAELSGVLLEINTKAVRFQSETAGEVSVPLAKVRALSLAEIAAKKREPAAPGVTALVQYRDGSSLAGRLIELGGAAGAGEGALRLATGLGDVVSPIEKVRGVTFRGGRCQYLSDLDPSKTVLDPLLPWPVQRDLAVLGGPLRLRSKEFKKGIGMHSRTRLDFPLDGKYLRFQSVIGMDDSAWPDSKEKQAIGAGTAVFRVHVDGRVAFEKQLAWSDQPLPIDIPLEGAKSMSLELDYGPGDLVLDRGDWANARIIRKG